MGGDRWWFGGEWQAGAAVFAVAGVGVMVSQSAAGTCLGDFLYAADKLADQVADLPRDEGNACQNHQQGHQSPAVGERRNIPKSDGGHGDDGEIKGIQKVVDGGARSIVFDVIDEPGGDKEQTEQRQENALQELTVGEAEAGEEAAAQLTRR